MIKQCTNMPVVQDCSVTKCAYNKENHCHTPAITVGSICPACDTFKKGEQAGEVDVNGGVGACRKADCQFNQALECHANGIHVGGHMMHADCMTYKKK